MPPMEIPASFLALNASTGHRLTRADLAAVAERHEFCEDLAQMLTETALDQLHQLHITESDVLERIQRGLGTDDAPTSPAEARWVVTRLAELLRWPTPRTAG